MKKSQSIIRRPQNHDKNIPGSANGLSSTKTGLTGLQGKTEVHAEEEG